MYRLVTIGLASLCITGTVAAAEFDPETAHATFMEGFNHRDWDSVRDVLTEDVVFHRANAEQVFVGRDAVMKIFQDTIGNDAEWNVKFAKLASDSHLTGKDSRVVERGEFAITAGEGDASCYAGSYMMTWAPQGDDWKLQTLAWQDVETDIANCQ